MRSTTLRSILTLAIAVIIGCVAPSLAAADVQGFMKIPGLPGESTNDRHAGEIDLVSYTQQAGTAACFKAIVVKGLDKASPGLALLAVTNQVVSPITITLSKSAAEPVDVFTATLENVVVGNVELVEVDGGPVPTERVTLRPRKATLSYRPQKADGSLDAPVVAVINCP